MVAKKILTSIGVTVVAAVIAVGGVAVAHLSLDTALKISGKKGARAHA